MPLPLGVATVRPTAGARSRNERYSGCSNARQQRSRPHKPVMRPGFMGRSCSLAIFRVMGWSWQGYLALHSFPVPQRPTSPHRRPCSRGPTWRSSTRRFSRAARSVWRARVSGRSSAENENEIRPWSNTISAAIGFSSSPWRPDSSRKSSIPRLASTRFFFTCSSSAGPARRTTRLSGPVSSSSGISCGVCTTRPYSRPRDVWQMTRSSQRSSRPPGSNEYTLPPGWNTTPTTVANSDPLRSGFPKVGEAVEERLDREHRMHVELERAAHVPDRLQGPRSMARSALRRRVGQPARHVRVYHRLLGSQSRREHVVVPQRDGVDGQPQLVPLGPPGLALGPVLVALAQDLLVLRVVHRLEPDIALAGDGRGLLLRPLVGRLQHEGARAGRVERRVGAHAAR